jgi:hypothetical protein
MGLQFTRTFASGPCDRNHSWVQVPNSPSRTIDDRHVKCVLLFDFNQTWNVYVELFVRY